MSASPVVYRTIPSLRITLVDSISDVKYLYKDIECQAERLPSLSTRARAAKAKHG